jgi:hypothetical protein
MSTLASLLLRSARLVVPAAAALSMIGGTSALAAPAKTPATVPFAWHTFTLVNGWESASNSNLRTGTPSWATHDGVMYFRGAIKNPAAAPDAEVARLPVSARPARRLYIEVYTSGGAPGTLIVYSNGEVDAFNGDSNAFTSLAGVSYPLASIKPHSLKLEHGWVSDQAIYGSGNPGYAISRGVVYLSGSLHGGTKPVALVLPKAARPPHEMYRSVYTSDGSTGTVAIRPNGQVQLFGASAADFTSLAAISYPVTGAKWHSFFLTGAWKSGASRFHSAAPAYTTINGVVYLTGTMYQTTGANVHWANIPAAVRPAALSYFEVNVVTGATGTVSIFAIGRVDSTPFADARAGTSLGGLSYPASS